MGQTIGTTHVQKISENKFSCEWSFCKVNFDFAYWSPVFGSTTSKEFSRCYLEMKPDIIHRVLTFYLRDFNGRSGSKMTSRAVLMDGKSTLHNRSREYDTCLGIEASVKIFEINLSDPLLTNCYNYIFKIEMNLQSSLTSTSPILNDNTLLQRMPNKTASSTLFNEKSTIAKSISGCNEKAMDTNHVENNETSAGLVIEEPANSLNLESTKKLVGDLHCLYTTGNMSDLEIHIGEDIFRVHKLILCARSTVFKTMLEQNFSESNSITITDCPAPPFEKFLKYLYTGEIEESQIDTLMYLYSLGDKYDIPILSKVCSNMLQNRFSSESVDDVANIVCDIAQLAECHSDLKLQDLTTSFIVNHFPVISKTQSWKDLMNSNVQLTSKILALVASGLQIAQT